jgi:hypothetical protein
VPVIVAVRMTVAVHEESVSARASARGKRYTRAAQTRAAAIRSGAVGWLNRST